MDASMTRRLESFFSPALTLYWRGRSGNRPAFYFCDRLADRPLLRQVLRDAGLDDKNSLRVADAQVDAVSEAASRNGYCLELVGGPECDADA